MRWGAHVSSMHAGPLKVLLVEDSEDDAVLLNRRLAQSPRRFVVERVDSAPAMSAALAREAWDLIISDYSLPQFDALGALALMRECGLDIPFIILSGTVGEEAAAEAMRAGAHDVVLKGNTIRLLPTIERELAEARLRQDLRATEAALVRSEKLSAVGQMAAGIAHDLINILNPLSFHLHAVEDLAKRGSDEVRESVTEMRSIVELGLEVVQRLRAFTGGHVPDFATVSVDHLVHDAIQLARPRAAALRKAVRIQEQLAGAPPIRVRADEVVAAVVNLVVNAIEAIGASGNVWVTTETAENGIVIEVRDDGPGIAPEIADRIFEAFFTTKGADGTGLGLAMVHATAERHMGKLELVPSDKGACFRLTLPRDLPSTGVPAGTPWKTSVQTSQSA